ncbi:response regulator [Robertkochia sediminum]|uniref:response regulator n=1 Tax=Robertkochia sediminum TaxID=2785326 RepID=UPI0019328EFF|nr:response regulator [Robertkochia sediminum]MBL7471661.1 response regulator [Robertkochia sediminum]
MRFIILLIALLFAPFSGVAQTDLINKDSLQGIIEKFYKQKNLANYEGALTELNRATELASIIDDERVLVDLYNLNTILNLEFNKNISPSLSLRLAKDDLNGSGTYPQADALTSVLAAYVQARNNNPGNALKEVNRAKELLAKVDPELLNPNTQTSINFYLGLTYKELENYAKAKVYFSKVGQQEHSFEKEYLKAMSNLRMAEIFFENDNFASARPQLENALQIASAREYPKILKDAHLLSYKILEEQGEYQKALYQFKQADSIIALYFNPDILQSQERASHENDIEMMQRTFDELNAQIKQGEATSNKQKLTTVLSSALLIIISLLTISLYRNNQIKIKSNDLLIIKNKELQLAKEEAEKAMKAKSQFLSTVSHELRTPLYAVTGLTHLLLEEDPKESQKAHLKSLKFSGEYLLDFINDILQINKIDANKVSLENQPFDLRNSLEDVSHSLEQTARENNNRIELDISPDIPPKIIGDSLKLSQIFLNLVGNALKFTNNGTVTLKALTTEKTDKLIKIHFEVVDEGIGISKEMQQTIFESFSQGSVQINRKYGGTGLGLTIVKSLLGLFNSEIDLESELGKGSRFFFDITFDLPEEKVAVAEKEETPEPLPVMESTDLDILKGLHILIVEDNKINQVITKKMLDKKDITCEIANDGYEAVDMAKSNEYDLILMDIHMPGISGLVATGQIREFDTNIPIIALTAISLDENTDDFFEAGCTDIITKPFKPDTFYHTIARVIGDSRASV